MRIGKRFGNTYVSTNGSNVRLTQKVAKNTYVSHTINKKTKTNKESGVGFLFGLIIVLGIGLIAITFLKNMVSLAQTDTLIFLGFCVFTVITFKICSWSSKAIKNAIIETENEFAKAEIIGELQEFENIKKYLGSYAMSLTDDFAKVKALRTYKEFQPWEYEYAVRKYNEESNK